MPYRFLMLIIRSAGPFLRLTTSVQTRVLRRRGTVGRRPAGAARNCARCAAGSRAAGAEGGRGLGALKLAAADWSTPVYIYLTYP
jgi:hypothetical protein